VVSRLDEEKLEMLRSWGEGLALDPRDEVRAAGKAILMLVEEIERLHVDLWHARQPALASAGGVPEPVLEAEEREPEPATRTLRSSIARLRGRHSRTASA
jgi:hypothetical protein